MFRNLFFIALSLILSPLAFAAEKHALLAAVTTYSIQQMNRVPLKYPEADAKAVAGLLRRSGYTVTLLTGKDATRAKVLDALRLISMKGDTDGVVLLGFFGHGVQYGPDAYFCPFDTSLREVRDSNANVLRDKSGLPRQEPDPVSMVSMRSMLDALSLSGAGNKLLLADCCREDPSTARGGLRGRAFGSDLRIENLPKNCAAMFACSEGEMAFESDAWKHGAFTKAILDACSQGRRITANGLSESVYFGVERLVTPLGERQRVNSLLAGGIIDLGLNALPKTFVNSIGATMVLIPAGTFLMGSPESDSEAGSDEKPQHEVTLTRSFYMGATEVTQGQWKSVMGTDPWKGNIFVREGANYPVIYVNWDEAVEFCRRLSDREGREYRLPTEAEWEYACRGGKSTKYSFGDDATLLPQYAWFEDNADKVDEKYSHLVQQKLANPFGLYDMYGNVWEWCSDRSGDYTAGSATDPVGSGDGVARVRRGGSWDITSRYCRSAFRGRNAPDDREYYLGFRLVSVSQ